MTLMQIVIVIVISALVIESFQCWLEEPVGDDDDSKD